MAVYTVSHVERVLRRYLDIRCALEGSSQQLLDLYVTQGKKSKQAPQPLGQTKTGQPWPFMEPQHAKPPMDGKAKARLMEDLHVSVLDIDEAFPKLSDDDQYLILEYHIKQSKTLDEFMAERKVTSRGSMQRRIARSVQRLTRYMES
jgi:hypothetical protein